MALSLAAFSELNPSNSSLTGGGAANLLYRSGSVPGEYIVQAMTLTFRSTNGINIKNALLQANTLTFELLGEWYTVDVTDVQLKSNYVYINFPDITIAGIPSTTHDPFSSGEDYPYYTGSQFVLNPYLELKFNNNDYNPLISNAIETRRSLYIQQVDRRNDQIVPTNYGAIIRDSATRAELQDSNYTTTGWVNARYAGTTLGDQGIAGDDPAQYLRSFKVSMHPSGSDLVTIKNTSLGDRTVETLYFNPKNILDKAFPVVGKIIYEAQGNKFSRSVEKSLYNIEDGKVYTTNNLGILQNIE